jgi:hypothetical protein
MTDSPDRDLPVTAADNPDQITLPAVKEERAMSGHCCQGKSAPIHRILLCISGSSSPSRDTLFAARLVSLLNKQSEITVLHVMSQISAGPGGRDEWQLFAGAAELIHNHAPEGELMKQDIQLLERSPAYISPKIRHGLVVEEI